MRRTFGLVVLLAALGGAQACLAQQSDQQQIQQQQDRQQRDAEQGLLRGDSTFRQDYHAMAFQARRHAEKAKTPEAKAKQLKMADHWDDLARRTELAQADR